MASMPGRIAQFSTVYFPKTITRALCVVVMFLFLAFIASLFLNNQPALQSWLLRASRYGFFVLIALAALHLIPLFAHLKNVKNGAPLIPKTLQNSPNRAWPKHSHPVARAVSWEPVEKDHIVSGKKTRWVMKSSDLAMQKISRSSIVFICILLVMGVLLASIPVILGMLVYEVTPPNIVALKKLVADLAVNFYCLSGLFVIASIYLLLRPIRLVTINKSSDIAYIRVSRCFGALDKLLKPELVVFKPKAAAGLQLVRHVEAAHHDHDMSKEQFELIMVLSDGTRFLLSKSSRYSALLKEAIKLAKFLGVDVWDRSSLYRPELASIASPLDPVIKAL